MKFTKTMARRILRFINARPGNYAYSQAGMMNSRGRRLPGDEIPEWDESTVPPKGYIYDEVALFLAFTPKGKRPTWMEAFYAMEDKIGRTYDHDTTIDALRRYAK